MPEQTFRIYRTADFRNPSLVVAWAHDAGGLGTRVIDVLNRHLGAEELGEIEPTPFFSLSGIKIEDDVIQFPQNSFHACERDDILTFQGDVPDRQHFGYLNTLLDIAQHHCQVKELFTIGAIVSAISHTSPRSVSAVVNGHEIKTWLAGYDIRTDTNYETPAGGSPTLNSFLLWLARRRNIAATSLWVEVPFYLASTQDTAACKHLLGILSQRFSLGLDLTGLDMEARQLLERMERLRRTDPQVGRSIERLEAGDRLSDEEAETLSRQVKQYLEQVH